MQTDARQIYTANAAYNYRSVSSTVNLFTAGTRYTSIRFEGLLEARLLSAAQRWAQVLQDTVQKHNFESATRISSFAVRLILRVYAVTERQTKTILIPITICYRKPKRETLIMICHNAASAPKASALSSSNSVSHVVSPISAKADSSW